MEMRDDAGLEFECSAMVRRGKLARQQDLVEGNSSPQAGDIAKEISNAETTVLDYDVTVERGLDETSELMWKIREVRRQVLWPSENHHTEKRVALADDHEGYHFAATDRTDGGEPSTKILGVVSLFPNKDEGGIAQLRKFAVLDGARGRGVGSQLLRTLLTKARELDIRRIFLTARETAVPFYEKHGFSVPNGAKLQNNRDYGEEQRYLRMELLISR